MAALAGVSAATLRTTWAVAAETSTQTEATTKEDASLAERAKTALGELVEGGTISQEQAGEVAEAPNPSDEFHPPRGHGHGPRSRGTRGG